MAGYSPAGPPPNPDLIGRESWESLMGRYRNTTEWLKHEASDEEYAIYKKAGGWLVPKRDKDRLWFKIKKLFA